jgi:hypothetical protein
MKKIKLEKMLEDLYVKDIEELINVKKYKDAIKFMETLGFR